MPFLPPPCTECGACCAHADPKWVEVDREDAAGIPGFLLQKGDIQPFAMRMCNSRCIALQGEVGQPTSCRIYNERPAICRRVQPGDDMCATMLGHHHLPLPFKY